MGNRRRRQGPPPRASFAHRLRPRRPRLERSGRAPSLCWAIHKLRRGGCHLAAIWAPPQLPAPPPLAALAFDERIGRTLGGSNPRPPPPSPPPPPPPLHLLRRHLIGLLDAVPPSTRASDLACAADCAAASVRHDQLPCPAAAGAQLPACRVPVWHGTPPAAIATMRRGGRCGRCNLADQPHPPARRLLTAGHLCLSFAAARCARMTSRTFARASTRARASACLAAAAAAKAAAASAAARCAASAATLSCARYHLCCAAPFSSRMVAARAASSNTARALAIAATTTSA